jgi:hypothetical protein
MKYTNLKFDSFATPEVITFSRLRQRKSKKTTKARSWRFAYRQRCANDIETKAFEVADDLLTASKQLTARLPDAQTWFVRIGHSAVDHFGTRSLRTKQ